MIRPALALLALFAACEPTDVELGTPPADAPTDAASLPIDAAPLVDASECRCRIPSCRDASDCTLIGGACGADLYCVGDVGTCRTDGECQATAAGSVCTQNASSTAACGT